jgi:hypothetical protein
MRLHLAVGLLVLLLGACGDSAPKIPHAISSEADSYCLTCHENGTNGAPRTPHPDRSGCTDCHTR